jgi:hypothetical protein
MNLNLEKRNLIIGGSMLIVGAVTAYLEPIGGALLAAAGGVVLQVHVERKAPDPCEKIRTKPSTKKP